MFKQVLAIILLGISLFQIAGKAQAEEVNITIGAVKMIPDSRDNAEAEACVNFNDAIYAGVQAGTAAFKTGAAVTINKMAMAPGSLQVCISGYKLYVPSRDGK